MTTTENNAVERITPTRLKVLLQTQNVPLLDVREDAEYQEEHLPNAIHIPLGQLDARISELEPFRTQKIYVYCKSGKRSFLACQKLIGYGFSVANLSGGILAFSDKMPKAETLEKIRKYAEGYWKKTGTFAHPDPFVSEAVLKGLALHYDELGKPLCPCNIYDDKAAEVHRGRWICPCDQMRRYKYCQCQLFVAKDGAPITEYLPDDHEGRKLYGEVKDPSPSRFKAAQGETARA